MNNKIIYNYIMPIGKCIKCGVSFGANLSDLINHKCVVACMVCGGDMPSMSVIAPRKICVVCVRNISHDNNHITVGMQMKK